MVSDDWYDEEPDDASDDDLLPCPECGAEIFDDAEQCPHCGWYVTPFRTRVDSRRQWVAIVLLVLMSLSIGGLVLRGF